MQLEDGRPIASILLPRVAAGASSADIANAVVGAFEEVDRALSPIVGRRGLAALLNRALHVAGARHSWLQSTFDDGRAPLDFEPLRSILACQSDSETAAGGGELLYGFRELLVALIGLQLTEQLLGSTWSQLISGPSAQGASSCTAR